VIVEDSVNDSVTSSKYVDEIKVVGIAHTKSNFKDVDELLDFVSAKEGKAFP